MILFPFPDCYEFGSQLIPATESRLASCLTRPRQKRPCGDALSSTYSVQNSFVLLRPVNAPQRCIQSAPDRAEHSRAPGSPLSELILPQPPSRWINRVFVCRVSGQCVNTTRFQKLPSPTHTTLLVCLFEGSERNKREISPPNSRHSCREREWSLRSQRRNTGRAFRSRSGDLHRNALSSPH